MANRIVEEANKWIGYLEKSNNYSLEDFTSNAGNNNYTIFAKQYKEYFGENYQGEPWCAMFVSCVFRNALGKEKQQRIMTHFAYCPTGVNQFKKVKKWKTSNPQIGDIIFFKDSKGIACHVGIVYSVDKAYVYTIEGNTSSKSGVVANGGGVFKKKYSLSYSKILGYGRPDYESVKETPWQQEFLDKLMKKGYINDSQQWSQYELPVSKALCVALIDKITGGIWDSSEANKQIHWAHPHVISLCGKGIITQPEDWINSLEDNISKALILALVDKATGGCSLNSIGLQKHWAQRHLESLQSKKIITTPEAWDNDFEALLNRGTFMALLCKAYNL